MSYDGGGLLYTQTFTYDSLNRLNTAKEVSGGATAWQQDFDYDQYGNRCIRTSPTVACAPAVHAANNRLTGFSYDLAGNQLHDDADHTYTYDAENHIKTVDGSTAYVYDGEGQRVRKLLGENIRMVYGISGELIAEFDGTTNNLKKEYIYGASGLVATIATGEGTRYTTADHLGSPRILTGSNGAVISRHDYQPFGEELFAGMGSRTSAQGYGATDGLRKQFTGYERDNETGLDYAQARYYSSMAGRFTSSDPLLSSGKVAQPQSWNRYSYCLNNPLVYVDPSGLIWVYQNFKQDGKNLRRYGWVGGNKAPKGWTKYSGSKVITLVDGKTVRLGHGSYSVIGAPAPQVKESGAGNRNAALGAFDGGVPFGKQIRQAAGVNADEDTPEYQAANKGSGAISGALSVASLGLGGLGSSADDAANLADDVVETLYYYTDEATAAAINRSGQIGAPGATEVFLTNKGNLSPLQAQIELALPAKNTAQSVFAVDVQTIGTSHLIRAGRVAGNVNNRAGGGFEFVLKGPIRSGFRQVR